MGKRRSFSWTLLVGLLLALHPCVVLAQGAGRAVIKRGVIADDLYVAGGKVDILAEVKGDVIAAGGRVSVGQLVEGDVMVAGGSVTVTGQVLDDVRATGGAVTIDGDIGGDVVVSGGSVSLTPETHVSGRTWLAGGEVVIQGTLDQELKAAGRWISLGGHVAGDVHLTAWDIEIQPTARIEGTLTYRSVREATIDPAAQIGGAITHQRIDRPTRGPQALLNIGRVLVLLSLLVAGIALFLLFPHFTVAAARVIGRSPWQSLGLGFALLVATPVAGCLLIVTLIGLPLGLTVCLLYVVSLLLGFLTAALFLGDLGARLFRRGLELSKGWRILSLVVALVVLGLLGSIPIAGTVILFLTLVFGLGAWSVHGYRTYASSRP